jgi:ABC-type transport system involved in multi-copper enzyme maturation permease subunit
MISSLALLTLRECFRRPFPYVLAIAIALVVVASRLFLAFTFGQERAEALNLAISAAFLASFGVATFVGTGLVRKDLERQTLAWLLTKPLGPAEYVAGRLLGLCAACIATSALAIVLSAPVLAHTQPMVPYPEVFRAGLRALPPGLVLGAAAIALSAIASRIVAPLLMLSLFLAGSFGGGFVLPDFSLFSLDANATAPTFWTALYALVFSSIFAVTAYIVLAIRVPARR